MIRNIQRDMAWCITNVNDPVYSDQLTYDANGNILNQVRNIGNQSTVYDALDQLKDATGPYGIQSFVFDRNGNRTSDTDNGTPTNYTYDPFSNRLNQTGLDPVVLDANGNATQLYGATLAYSPDNRLTGVTGISDYGYNGIGERVRKTVGGTTTLYLYGPGGQLMAELDDTGQVERVYVYFAGEPLAVVDYVSDPAGTLYYIHNDHLGTPQGLTDEAGVVVWRAVYTPFGLATVDEDPDLDTVLVSFNLRFPGQYFDGETGFHYNYFRYYDPYTGRYITSDPIGLSGGLNTFAYVNNNPLKFVDPLGLLNPGEAACAAGPNPVCVVSVTVDILTVLFGVVLGVLATSPDDVCEDDEDKPDEDEDEPDCDEHLTRCLGTPMQSIPGSVHKSSRCLSCRDICVRNDGIWPHIGMDTRGSFRCDYWKWGK